MISRRSVLASIFSPFCSKLIIGQPKKWGRLDWNAAHEIREKRGVYLRVLLNGRDATHVCREADDGEGWALLYRVNERGRFYLDETGCVAMRHVQGQVRFVSVSKEYWLAQLHL